MAEEYIETDPLFLALTRPSTLWGVTYSFFIINLMVTSLLFLTTKNLLMLFVFIPAHAIGYLMCLKDIRYFEIFFGKVTKTPRVRNFKYWKSNTYSP